MSTFKFDGKIVTADTTGYYHPRWDQATPITVYADTRDAATKKAIAVMPPTRRGWKWTVEWEHITEVTQDPEGGTR